MAVVSSGSGEAERRWRGQEEAKTRVWTEPLEKLHRERRTVAVVYYLSRNGQLEHPHFMEIPLHPFAEGLFLHDVISRLNFLRGKGMASLYSWSSKRSYKNGFVWQDLAEDDLVLPAHGNEYILKGSEILFRESVHREATFSLSSSEKHSESASRSRGDSEFTIPERKKASWTSIDLPEYKIYKAELTAESAAKAADASTQTDDRKQKEPPPPSLPPHQPSSELGIDDISPPQSSSSPETLESLIKTDAMLASAPQDDRTSAAGCAAGGRSKASAMLMHLISCGSISVKDHTGGFSLVSHYKSRVPRPRPPDREATNITSSRSKPASLLLPSISLGDREYFSGSLVETTKKKTSDAIAAEFPGLKRSSSYNADRGSKMEVALRNDVRTESRLTVISHNARVSKRRNGHCRTSKSELV